jgi:hypothetical protein
VTDDDAAVAAELAAKAAARGDIGGRTVFAANRALDWPDHPLARLWHATTLLREHRGGTASWRERALNAAALAENRRGA